MKPAHIIASELRDQGVKGITMEQVLAIQKDTQEALAKYTEEAPSVAAIGGNVGGMALVERGFAEHHAKRIREFKL